MPTARLACIDIGSNTTRLLVADCAAGELVEIHQERAFTRIGRAIDGRGVIAGDKIAEVARVVAGQLAIAEALGASEVHVVATASVRRAANGAALSDGVTRACGLSVRVLSEADEARLAFVGAARAVDRPGGGELGVADIGGGSTELAVGRPPGAVRWSVSLALGSGELSERLLRSDPPPPAELAAGRAHVAAALGAVDVPRPAHAVAVGGSAASLSRLTGGRLVGDALARALDRLLAAPAAEVAAATGLDPERVRLLPAGLLILEGVGARFGVPLEVGRGGIREAVVLEAAADLAV
jgi:exopolyphosphatase/guanosine-5'-triphosphate,3'-diphosphate pyrophosphatase